VATYPNVSYPVPGGTLRLDIYAPSHRDPAKSYPILVMLHGFGESRAPLASLGRAAARHGYAAVALDYRTHVAGGFAGELRDVDAGLDFVRSRAARYGADPHRVAGFGWSLGALLISDAALRDGQPMRALVGWSGAYDLTTVGAENPAVAALVAAQLACVPAEPACRQRERDYSPVSHVGANAPPTFLAWGTADTFIPRDQITSFAGALRAHGVPVTSKVYPGAGHAGGLLGPATDATLTFLDDQLHP
jgi:acetyl esterase/lipase